MEGNLKMKRQQSAILKPDGKSAARDKAITEGHLIHVSESPATVIGNGILPAGFRRVRVVRQHSKPIAK
jgi:hypothetical protein